MKKAFIIIICLIFLIGCKNNDSKKVIYQNYVNELSSVEKSDNLNFDIDVNLYRLNDKIIRYEMVLDNIKEDMEQVTALIVHNKETNDIYPSIGIFDEKITLKENGKPKGIVLVGYIDSEESIEKIDIIFKILVEYKINKEIKKVYYVTKK